MFPLLTLVGDVGQNPPGGSDDSCLPDVEKSGPVNEAGERRVKPCSPLAMRRPGLGAASSHINFRHRWGHLSFTGNESANKSEVNMQDAERVVSPGRSPVVRLREGVSRQAFLPSTRQE